MCLCNRCGEQLTAPKFHNGYPYGYSCYEIVAGEKPRDKRKFAKADPAEIPSSVRFNLKLIVNGKRYSIAVYRDTQGKLQTFGRAIFCDNGDVYLVTHDQKGKALYKNPV